MPNTPQKVQTSSSKTLFEFSKMGYRIKISTSSKCVAIITVLLMVIAVASIGVWQLTLHRADKTTSVVSIPAGTSAIGENEFRQTANGTSNKNTVELHKTAESVSQPTKLIQKANGSQNINSVVINE